MRWYGWLVRLRLRFGTRDLFWLVLTVGISLSWWLDSARTFDLNRMRSECDGQATAVRR